MYSVPICTRQDIKKINCIFYSHSISFKRTLDMNSVSLFCIKRPNALHLKSKPPVILEICIISDDKAYCFLRIICIYNKICSCC